MITLASYLVLGIFSVLPQAPVAGQVASSPQQAPAKATSTQPSRNSAAKIAELKTKAEAGDAGAQAALGKAYLDGDGVSQSDAMALKWFRAAVDQGDVSAESTLGVMYRMGQGVFGDKEEAVRWYRKAAKQGDARARFNLGAAYYNGDGVASDDVASYVWFLLAQEVGNPAADEAVSRAASERVPVAEAYVRIAEMYEAGNDLPKNPAEILKWYRKAADAGDENASVKLASRLLAPGRAATPEESDEALQRCEDLGKKNYAPAAYCVAQIYRRGLGRPQNIAEGAKWLGLSAELGVSRAFLELGEDYWKGQEGFKADPVLAYQWIWTAYTAKVQGAEQDEQQLSKELSPKQIQEAKQSASDFAKKHWAGGLRLRSSGVPPPSK